MLACAAAIPLMGRAEGGKALEGVAVVLDAMAAGDDLAPGRVFARAPPMQKKLARTPAASSRSSTRGVTSGSGPSSMVSAISLRAAAASGRRVRLAPSRVDRGSSPATVSTAWLAASAPSVQGQAAGIASVPSAAAPCRAKVAFIAGEGFQAWGMVQAEKWPRSRKCAHNFCHTGQSWPPGMAQRAAGGKRSATCRMPPAKRSSVP
jgi:hypothetical protein